MTAAASKDPQVDLMPSTKLNFAQANEHMRQGNQVCRACWGGRYLVQISKKTDPSGFGANVIYERNAGYGAFERWCPGVEDISAFDWEVVD